MNETANVGAYANRPEQPISPEGAFKEELAVGPEERRAAYEGWLERRNIDPASVPQLAMNGREFILFANAAPDLARRTYNIPSDDQDPCRYVLVDVESSDPGLPSTPELVAVYEADFGTKVDFERIAKDFDPNPSPDGPPTPESGPTATYVRVDIKEALARSNAELQDFATALMQGNTTDPFNTEDGNIAVRAGGLMPGQKDAYVWTAAPIAKSVELTLLNPTTYDSVCVVRGQIREASNGKPGMAQMDNPEVVLKIKDRHLAHLQEIYRELYSQPDFALTDDQRHRRDDLFNSHVSYFISEAARRNQASQEDEERRRLEPPRVRYLGYPDR